MNFDKIDSNQPSMASVPSKNQPDLKPTAKGDGKSPLEDLVNGTSHIIQVMQSKNIKLSKAKYLWQNRKIGMPLKI